MAGARRRRITKAGRATAPPLLQQPARPAAGPDYYDILGVEPSASQEAIAHAYRRLAARYTGRGGEAESQQLKLVNAAYAILGNAARRTDYDRRRALAVPAPTMLTAPPLDGEAAPPPAAPRARTLNLVSRGWPERVGVVMVVAVALLAGIAIVQDGGLVEIGTPLADAARVVGLLPDQRVAAAAPTMLAGSEPASAAPTAAPSPSPRSLAEQLKQTTVVAQPANPGTGTDVAIVTTVRRNGEPVPNLPLHLVAHYRTVDERWPPGSGRVTTDESGTARISFNIGNATRGYTVKVDVIATIDGQEVVWHGEFTPR